MTEQSKNKTVRVQAICLCFYGLRRYKPGEIFVVESMKYYNPRAMRRLKDKPGQIAEPPNGVYQAKIKLAYGSEEQPDPAVIPAGEEALDESEAAKIPQYVDHLVAPTVKNPTKPIVQKQQEVAQPSKKQRVEDQDVI